PPPPPLLVAWLAQQPPEWVGKNMDGWLSYPGTPADHVSRVKPWRTVAGDKPYVSFLHLDLTDIADAPIQRHRFGTKSGPTGLIQELSAMRDPGLNHLGLHFRRIQRPPEETMQEIGQPVLPEFHRGSRSL
ncbi:LLM class flavin-dependent oxidoreductase, partial [Serratia ureilytica]